MLREVFGRFPPLYRQINRARGYRLHEPTVKLEYAVLGTIYGAWTVPDGLLKPDSVVYSFGLGEDISFDLAVIEKFGCTVHGFDPTPIAGDWLQAQSLDKRFAFHPIGLSETDGMVDFFTPPEGHSFSRTSQGGTSVARRVSRLATIMADLGHSHIDLLKMDIEGFEYAVIKDFLASGIRPTVINVEYHHKSYDISARDTLSSVEMLLAVGYEPYWISDLGREYAFIIGHNRAVQN